MPEEQARISIKDDRKKRWLWMDNRVFNGFAADMKPSGIAVYCALLRHVNNSTAKAWPSMRTIADKLGLSTTTVNDALKRLECLKLISVTRPGSPQGNTYTVLEVPHVSETDVSETDTYQKLTHYVSETDTYVSETDTELNLLTKLRTKQRKPKNKKGPLDLILETKTAQDKLKYPIEYLSGVVVELLGLHKIPNYKFDELWSAPIDDLLDQADRDVDEVEVALRAAAAEGQSNGMTMTTPNSLHGLALKSLAVPSVAPTPPDAIKFFTPQVPDGWTLPKRGARK